MRGHPPAIERIHGMCPPGSLEAVTGEPGYRRDSRFPKGGRRRGVVEQSRQHPRTLGEPFGHERLRIHRQREGLGRLKAALGIGLGGFDRASLSGAHEARPLGRRKTGGFHADQIHVSLIGFDQSHGGDQGQHHGKKQCLHGVTLFSANPPLEGSCPCQGHSTLHAIRHGRKRPPGSRRRGQKTRDH